MSAQEEFEALPEWLKSLWNSLPSTARIVENELAQLRATITALQAENATLHEESAGLVAACHTISAQKERITELEAAVKEARVVISDAVNHHGGGTKSMRVWLEMHPQEQQA